MQKANCVNNGLEKINKFSLWLKGERNMKKNLITLMAAIAILASSASAFAEENVQTDVNSESTVVNEVVTTSNENDAEVSVSTSNYISNTGIVSGIEDGIISTVTDITDAENPENIINFTTTENTLVVDAISGEIKSVEDVKEDDMITVYTNALAPAPLILPAQYRADVIVVNSRDNNVLGFIDVDTYEGKEEGLVNMANTLALNNDEKTVIVDKEGNEYTESLENKDLLVIYTNSTRSIPAQTTPVKVIVFGENEVTEETPVETPVETPEETEDVKVNFAAVESINVGDKTITDIYAKGETVMVPLREIAEELGLSVEWDGNLNAVMINDGIYSIKIGENSYVKGRMTPVELSAAPEITNDWTYVPVEYFFEVVESKVNVNTDENGNAQSLTLSAE
jgi:hypothetical protein